jgi:hypothetical protein
VRELEAHVDAAGPDQSRAQPLDVVGCHEQHAPLLSRDAIDRIEQACIAEHRKQRLLNARCSARCYVPEAVPHNQWKRYGYPG